MGSICGKTGVVASYRPFTLVIRGKRKIPTTVNHCLICGCASAQMPLPGWEFMHGQNLVDSMYFGALRMNVSESFSRMRLRVGR